MGALHVSANNGQDNVKGSAECESSCSQCAKLGALNEKTALNSTQSSPAIRRPKQDGTTKKHPASERHFKVTANCL